ncbi:hypothetical protein V9T40_012385 [Parthenolecanium corni]|uniref:Uncharacterized protein n=1 Tax=Parthenolecanium corni TaxID=536013 RepID=A0AAN9T8K5_9HEMI
MDPPLILTSTHNRATKSLTRLAFLRHGQRSGSANTQRMPLQGSQERIGRPLNPARRLGPRTDQRDAGHCPFCLVFELIHSHRRYNVRPKTIAEQPKFFAPKISENSSTTAAHFTNVPDIY